MTKDSEFKYLDIASDISVIAARRDMETYGIPKRDYDAWRSQYHSAKTRGIPFNFNLLGWRQWWHSALYDIDPSAKRGKHRHEYVMARIGDSGPYEPGNVFAATPAQNMASRDPLAMEASVRKATLTLAARGKPRGIHLRIRGDGHPKSKRVQTPSGVYGSIALAAEAHGITRAGGHYRVKRGDWTLA